MNTILSYYSLMRNSKDPRYLRLALVRYAEQYGVKPAARQFSTTVKTVRKWFRRWQKGTLEGLQDQSRAPKNPARKIMPESKDKVIELKRQLPSFGAERIKRDFDLTVSEKTIRRIWREEGLTTKKRRKHKTKQDLRKIKALWRLFEQTCLDTKDLIDIPKLWPQIQKLKLPKIQYTAREVISGLQFIAFAQERSVFNSTIFAKIIIDHLQKCGVIFDNCRFQTDNGSEFIGAWNAKEDCAFTKTVQDVDGLRHQTIPPGAHTWQADVETTHRLIEDEFYHVEAFSSRSNFLAKATAYNLWFNVARKNSYKNHQTPWQIIQKRNNKLNPNIAILPPVFLDKIWKIKLDSFGKGGYHVIQYPFLSVLTHFYVHPAYILMGQSAPVVSTALV